MNSRTPDEIRSFVISKIANFIQENKEKSSRSLRPPQITLDEKLASTLAEFEKGNGSISVRDLSRVLYFYGVSPEEILEFLSRVYIDSRGIELSPVPE